MASPANLKIAYITAGGAGMYCGSCMHDNTLVAALIKQGHDALLVPTYTPLRTDEPDVSQKRVFFGGINVYLQQKFGLFRRTPWLFDRLLDAPGLLRWVSRFAIGVEARQLGEMTVSMLKGEHGRQSKEVAKLVAWLAEDARPQLVSLTAVLLSGLVHEMKRVLRVPVLCALQGDDIFLDALVEPYRGEAMKLVREHCGEIDGFVATSGYYADHMAGYLGVPRERVHVVLPGLNLAGHGGPRPPSNGPPYAIGYFARVCPEKGLHNLAEAFHLLRKTPGTPPCRLRVAGWLGEGNRPYLNDVQDKLRGWGLRDKAPGWGLGDEFEYVACPGHADKVRFLHGVDVLSVPTTYREPKGLYVLEALANGVPVVQPRHGSFPELVEATGGGLLVNPDDPQDLANGLRRILEDQGLREELGRKGKEAVHRIFTAERMAEETAAVYRRYLP